MKFNVSKCFVTRVAQSKKYRMEGNFGRGNVGEFGESSVIRQTKTIQISTYHNNLLADLLIHQTFFCQMLKRVDLPMFSLTKVSLHTVQGYVHLSTS